MAIEKIAVMHPNVFVVLLEANVVAFIGINVHDPYISHFDILRILYSNTPTVCSRIVANTFERYRHPLFFTHINDNITMIRIGRIRHIANQTNCKRTRFKTFL